MRHTAGHVTGARGQLMGAASPAWATGKAEEREGDRERDKWEKRERGRKKDKNREEKDKERGKKDKERQRAGGMGERKRAEEWSSWQAGAAGDAGCRMQAEQSCMGLGGEAAQPSV